MRHNSLRILSTLYNLVKVGGNTRFPEVDTSETRYVDARKDFISLVRQHGYDILTPSDYLFNEKVNMFNRAVMLERKNEGFDTYEEYKFREICICGPWIFTEAYSIPTEEIKIKDLRGGSRKGAGRRAKRPVASKISIRVPREQHNQIRDLVDWLASEGSAEIIDALDAASETLSDNAEDCVTQEYKSKLLKKAELLDQLRIHIPFFQSSDTDQ